jgi:hypothetical protein
MVFAEFERDVAPVRDGARVLDRLGKILERLNTTFTSLLIYWEI